MLKAYYLAARARNKQVTQQCIGEKLGSTQSRVAGWLNGHQRVPDYALERLGEILGFDPNEVRPGFKDGGMTADEEAARLQLGELICQLDSARREQAIDFIRFILHSRK